ncbi:hypothetical protein ES703_122443 [subsurface metagenome]
MPAWLLVAAKANLTIAEAATKYLPLSGTSSPLSNEDNGQVLFRDSYTLSKLYVRVVSNNVDNASTVRLRKNLANGNQSVSIPANTTGVFEDTVNSDSFVNGDLAITEVIVGAGVGGDVLGIRVTSYISTSPNDVPILVAATTGGTSVDAGVTEYACLIAGGHTDLIEAAAQYIFRTASILSNMRIYVNANGLTAASTHRLRKNGANGNQSVSIGAGATGSFEDAVNTDSVAVGNSLNYRMAAGATGTKITWRLQQVKSTSIVRQMGAVRPDTTGFNFGTTNYMGLETSPENVAAVETETQVRARISCGGRNLLVRVTANTVDGASTISLRRNAGNTALLVSVPAAASGVFEDSDDVNISVNDLLNYMADIGGTAGAIVVTIIGFELRQPAVGIQDKSANMPAKMIAGKLI